MSAMPRIVVPLLAAAVFGTALAVVWNQFQTRSLFIQLQQHNAERDALDIAWGQLKIEQSAWSSHGRVEQTARANLKMIVPPPRDVRLVKPDA